MPLVTGSLTARNTIGIPPATRFAACAPGVDDAISRSGFDATNSAAYAANRLATPSDHLYSITKFWPSIQPN